MTEHEEIRQQLSAHCGGELAPAERQRLEEHLAGCPDCRRELADLETTLGLLRSQPQEEPPPWLTSRIMARVREEAGQRRRWWQWWLLPQRAQLPLEALAIAVVCVLSYFVVRDAGQLPPPVPPAANAPAGEQAAEPRQERLPDAVPPVGPGGARPVPVAPGPAPQVEAYAPAPPRPAAAPAPPPAATLRDEAAPAARSREAVGGAPAPALEAAPPLQKAEPEAKKSRSLDGGSVRGEADSRLAAPAAPMPQLAVRLAVADLAGAEAAIRSAVARSGGTVAGQPAPRQLSVRVPARRLAELLAQLAAVGPLAERPAMDGLSGPVEVVIRW